MRSLVLATALLLLPFHAEAVEMPLGMKVNRFQVVTKALHYPGLYDAATEYIKMTHFPTNDIVTCYWWVAPDSGDIRITAVLPDTTRTVVFTMTGYHSWKASEI